MTEAANFTVFWNVPSAECHRYGIYINASKYGIVQNADDVFFGDKVAIFYKPGMFPSFEGNVSINGGIPQKGNLDTHKNTFRSQVEMMTKDFQGIAVLDFEFYLPGLSLAPEVYKNASHDWVASLHPTWTSAEIDAEAERSFNASARVFMEVLLQIGKEMRPKALWGYYHYPYCGNSIEVTCRSPMPEFNNMTAWIYQASAAMYPSIYVFEKWPGDAQGRRNMVLGRLREATRIRSVVGGTAPILSYCWFMYHDTPNYITPVDLVNTIGLSKMMGMEGAVMWGGPANVSTKEKCIALQTYVDSALGPLVQYIDQMPESYLRRAFNSRRFLEKIVALALAKVHSTD